MTALDWRALDPLIRIALREDIGRGDVTGEACVPARVEAVGRIVAKQAGVVAGLPVAARAFRLHAPSTRFAARVADGRLVRAGATLAVVRGRARALLAAERVALNLLGRLSGIATLTRAYVRAAGNGLTVLDTRKTSPGWRVAERYAVRLGGGTNHRFNLAAAAMLKTNHLRLAGGMRDLAALVADCRRRAPRGSVVVVEAVSVAEFRAAADAGADVVLCDNMADAQLRRCCAARIGHRPLIEVSGRVTPARARRLRALGVERVSVGALTHSAPALDVALRLEPA